MMALTCPAIGYLLGPELLFLTVLAWTVGLFIVLLLPPKDLTYLSQALTWGRSEEDPQCTEEWLNSTPPTGVGASDERSGEDVPKRATIEKNRRLKAARMVAHHLRAEFGLMEHRGPQGRANRLLLDREARKYLRDLHVRVCDVGRVASRAVEFALTPYEDDLETARYREDPGVMALKDACTSGN